MPKQKTKKSLTRRLKITKTGKVLRRSAFKRHLNVKKSSKRKRRLRRGGEITGKRAVKIKKFLGIRKRKNVKK